MRTRKLHAALTATVGHGRGRPGGRRACTPSTEQHRSKPIASPGVTASGTITFWHFFTDREATAIQGVVNDFEASHPNIKVVVKDGQDDDKMTQAIAAGQRPRRRAVLLDRHRRQVLPVRRLAGPDPVHQARQGRHDQHPGAGAATTPQYNGKRCTMPFLTDAYGIYYNKDMFAAKPASPTRRRRWTS